MNGFGIKSNLSNFETKHHENDKSLKAEIRQKDNQQKDKKLQMLKHYCIPHTLKEQNAYCPKCPLLESLLQYIKFANLTLKHRKTNSSSVRKVVRTKIQNVTNPKHLRYPRQHSWVTQPKY